MLRELSIRNFAIIEDLRINFEAGLSILSGETGAGKSILINAVNLLLGSRASVDLIRTGEESAELEALFEVAPESRSATLLKAHGDDPCEGLVIRRVVSRNHRHRIYLNGRLATMQLLKEITGNLASISGQHAHQQLLKEELHLTLLDQFGGLMPLRASVRQQYGVLAPLLDRRKTLAERQAQKAERMELLQFQLTEITGAAIEPEEDQQLEAERTRLRNIEQLHRVVSGSLDGLYSNPGAAIETITEVRKMVEAALRMDGSLDPIVAGLAEAVYQLEDICERLRNYGRTLEVADNSIAATEERLDLINRLKRKYGGSLTAIASRVEAITAELEASEHLDTELEALDKEIAKQRETLIDLSLALSEKRHHQAQRMARQIEAQLGALKMAPIQFDVALIRVEATPETESSLVHEKWSLSEKGLDRAQFLISPNVGEAIRPLASIASGGELSRVVLALRAILAKTDAVQTIVFDEVDAGIGGEVAEIVGAKLDALARRHQIICITHLPQIAKFGQAHFKIAKKVISGRTTTTISALETEERVCELARMLGGVEITDTTLAHAREMLGA
ncbi:MAG: DNA repair protein RecN [Desulfosarcinaceae bacterium]|nr:DNA repair protein RecN [Desulfosarcinaceae bacterium]